ncbi:hypothetical protein PG995_004338 [Apiospora arundinis]
MPTDMSLLCSECERSLLDGGGTICPRAAAEPELQEYDSEQLKHIKRYSYTRLPSGKKRIRLMRLHDASTSNSGIYCEFIEAEYDNFHIPRRATDEETEKIPDLPDFYEFNLEACTDADKVREIQAKREKHREMKLEERKERREKRKQKTKTEKDEEEEEANKKEDEKWEKAWDNRVQYDALSWCWGTDFPNHALMVRKGDQTYKLRIKRELALALKYLRHRDKMRTLWVDAVCIDQANPNERNHQVQMMSRIYTRASMVCIWLGEHTENSKIAIDFIRDEVMELRNIETICTDKRYTRKWQALQMLMQTEWFSRRWVVQEIALAKKAEVCCGADKIPWKDFAIAVELFVEVETATHRLSEIMQHDEKFRHIPNWFEYVSELGASLLVQATGKVFRGQVTPLQDDKEGEDKNDQLSRWKKTRTMDLLERRSLLSLEYLVSTMFIFKATEPRDVVYSLLAIARDAAPFAGATFDDADPSYLTMRWFEQFLEEKPFLIDYGRPYPDVCRDFVSFVIKRKSKIDAVQALDILCRPWSLEQPKEPRKLENFDNKDKEKGEDEKKEEEKRKEEKQKEELRKKEERDKRKWFITKSKFGAGTTEQGKPRFWLVKEASDTRTPDPRSTEQYREEFEKAHKDKTEWPIRNGDHVLHNWKPAKRWAEWHDWCIKYKDKEVKRDVTELPSWVARASRAPFILDYYPGMHVKKVGRANSDPLVGLPTDGHRNYNAAQTRPVNLDVLKFRRRPELGHYSMYVQGFILDEVKEVMDASQGGDIPRSWLELGGWVYPFDKDPPDDLWRTLVADRGRDNRNPPYYYARACRESAQKGNINSGRIATMSLINNERNSIITEFCRRVHAVIWNRRMFKTTGDRLGLAYDVKPGDKICVLYGCTVPVVLKQSEKKRDDVDKEEQADRREALKACIRHFEDNYERKQWRKKQHDKNWKKWLDSGEWYEMLSDKKIAEGRLQSKENTSEQEGEKGVEQEQEQQRVDENKREDENNKKKKKKKKKKGKGKEKGTEAGEQEEREEEKESQTEQSKDDGSSSHESSDTVKTSLKEKSDEAKQEDPHLHYTFRGDCYLHGMMDGEAVREKFYGEFPDRIFELR